MFGLFNHPATQFVCRHCGKNAGYDPEHCFYCGPFAAIASMIPRRAEAS